MDMLLNGPQPPAHCQGDENVPLLLQIRLERKLLCKSEPAEGQVQQGMVTVGIVLVEQLGMQWSIANRTSAVSECATAAADQPGKEGAMQLRASQRSDAARGHSSAHTV